MALRTGGYQWWFNKTRVHRTYAEWKGRLPDVDGVQQVRFLPVNVGREKRHAIDGVQQARFGTLPP